MASNKTADFQKTHGFTVSPGVVDRKPSFREVSVVRKRSSREYVDRPLLDIPGAASHLGCSERFIRRLVQERRIPFVKLAGTRVTTIPEIPHSRSTKFPT
jgi:excisionase family DNA binding protein